MLAVLLSRRCWRRIIISHAPLRPGLAAAEIATAPKGDGCIPLQESGRYAAEGECWGMGAAWPATARYTAMQEKCYSFVANQTPCSSFEAAEASSEGGAFA